MWDPRDICPVCHGLAHLPRSRLGHRAEIFQLPFATCPGCGLHWLPETAVFAI